MKMNKHICRTITMLLLIVAASTSNAQSGAKYPYVLNGKIIVSRDYRGGAKTDLLHPKWASTPAHNYDNLEMNRVSWKFEVADADVINTNQCPAGWRGPTQKELLLMYVVKVQLTANPFAHGTDTDYTIISLTQKNSSSTFYYNTWSENFGWKTISQSSSTRMRCIRDLD